MTIKILMLADVAGAAVLAHSVHNPFLHKTIFFTYRGWRGGEPWRVPVHYDAGRIVSTRPAG